ncbi:MAG TPA: sigma-70 family RNA polymerase sigma factor [Candidatus Limnocylindria bacterium]|jgi:RNA polymerase sigma-70 factor, ECF subfamily|nr:sigma-70 family RNA polymerase sigma factor [Candidatus Limnocylindria bacterium]
MDRQLVDRARAGDREAFGQIVLATGEPLFRTALAILGNEADARDATQETFVAAWRGLASLRDPHRFDAWLGRILVNECRMALRRRSRVRELPMADGTDRLPTDHPVQPNTDPDFDAAFDRLSADQRAILVLHHLHGYGVGEIAARLGVPAGTIKWRLWRARTSLRRGLDDHG